MTDDFESEEGHKRKKDEAKEISKRNAEARELQEQERERQQRRMLSW